MSNQIKINFPENCKTSFNEIDNSINIEVINSNLNDGCSYTIDQLNDGCSYTIDQLNDGCFYAIDHLNYESDICLFNPKAIDEYRENFYITSQSIYRNFLVVNHGDLRLMYDYFFKGKDKTRKATEKEINHFLFILREHGLKWNKKENKLEKTIITDTKENKFSNGRIVFIDSSFFDDQYIVILKDLNKTHFTTYCDINLKTQIINYSEKKFKCSRKLISCTEHDEYKIFKRLLKENKYFDKTTNTIVDIYEPLKLIFFDSSEFLEDQYLAIYKENSIDGHLTYQSLNLRTLEYDDSNCFFNLNRKTRWATKEELNLFTTHMIKNNELVNELKNSPQKIKSDTEISYIFVNSDKQREIIDKLAPGTFNDELSDRVNCLNFLKIVKEKNLYQELSKELYDTINKLK